MAVRTRDRGVTRALDALADAARSASSVRSSGEALEAIADAARIAAGADVAVVRVLDRAAGIATARAVCAESPALAAQLAGTSLAADELPSDAVRELAEAPAGLARLAARAGATALLQLPLESCGEPAGSLELLRAGAPFGERERAYAALAAAQAALALRAFGSESRHGAAPAGGLELAGDALALPAAAERTSERLLRLAAEATGARSAALWRERGGRVELVDVHGADGVPEGAPEAAAAALRGGAPTTLAVTADA